MLKRLSLYLLTFVLGTAACNAPAAGVTASPTANSPIDPTQTIVPTALSVTEAFSPTANIATFESALREALVKKDFAQLEQCMGDAFLVNYVGGASGMITISDAITLLRDNLLAGTASIRFDDNLNTDTLDGVDLSSLGFEVDKSLFSSGWGEDSNDHAVVLIGMNSNSGPYFAGLIYGRGGFAGVATATTPAATTGVSDTPAPAVAAPDPAPRGASVFESDFRQGWWEHEENDVKTTHANSGYEISVGNGPNGGWSFTTQTQRAEFYAEVSAEALECPSTNGAYGLIFHYQDDSHFRFFILWCNGKYSLMERTATTTAAVLIEGVLPASIDPATGVHRIGVLALNTTLALYVDDLRIGAIGVPTMPSGDVGPYVQTLSRETIAVRFTRLTVFQTK